MMSFRRYVDVTAIAQLLGRMVRTPIHQRIMVDDMLNDVQLFLPHFDKKMVKKVVDELQNEEGGELPTEIIGDWVHLLAPLAPTLDYQAVSLHPCLHLKLHLKCASGMSREGWQYTKKYARLLKKYARFFEKNWHFK